MKKLCLNVFKCAADGCNECDAFDPAMETAQDGRNCGKHFCGLCAIKMHKITTHRRPFVDTHHPWLTCINESIAKVSSLADQRSCTKMTLQAIANLERSWLMTASGLRLSEKNDGNSRLKMQNTFSSDTEYCDRFKHLVSLDLSLTRMEISAIPKLENLVISEHDTSRSALWFEFQTGSQMQKRYLQCGQPVLVHFSSYICREPIKATVKFNRETNNLCTVRVEFSVDAGKSGTVLPVDGHVAVKVGFQDTIYCRQLAALDRFGILHPGVQAFLLGTGASESSPSLADATFEGSLFATPGRQLNPSQEAAVRLALSPGTLSLIQGPPGTGKTHTIVAMVANLLRQNFSTQILCCAPSNDPTDHLAVQLVKLGVDVLRIHAGRTELSQLPHELRVLTLDFQLEERFGRDYRRAGYKGLIESAVGNIVEGVQVICTTCNSSVVRALTQWPTGSDNVLIIDEATQATEVDALIPITKKFKKIMIGDHKQLGVVNRFRELERTNLGCSLFERLMHLKQVPSIMLDTQYRMHPRICAPASAIMYDGRLKTGQDVAVIREVSGDCLQFLHLSPRFTPLVMVDIATRHELAADRTSTVNPHEALVVGLCLVNFLQRKVKPEDVGVITFYNGQKDFLKKLIGNHSCIPESWREKLMIDSVDAFQGRERDYIILSCVRSGDADTTSIGFLQNERRLTVALTRAKKGVLAVGDRTLLETSRQWREFLRDYVHVSEKDALRRLGAQDVRNPTCCFCEDGGKRISADWWERTWEDELVTNAPPWPTKMITKLSVTWKGPEQREGNDGDPDWPALGPSGSVKPASTFWGVTSGGRTIGPKSGQDMPALSMPRVPSQQPQGAWAGPMSGQHLQVGGKSKSRALPGKKPASSSGLAKQPAKFLGALSTASNLGASGFSLGPNKWAKGASGGNNPALGGGRP